MLRLLGFEGLYMKVSVVVPTFYRSDALSEFFDSLLKQTVKPIETVIVDDTPTDAIRNLCGKYSVKFKEVGVALVYIKNPKERSASIARNVGVKNARGDVVMFFDSDVILYSDYIERILEVFKAHPNALGVQGWIVNLGKGKFYYLFQTLNKLFLLQHHSEDSCKYSEYPIVLTKIINCEWLSGANMALKPKVFNEFRFDENLKKYSFMEDFLLSHSIFKKYPNGLFMTPQAKCVHKVSKKGRMNSINRKEHIRRCRKYVFTKLFGSKGLLVYHWQNVGILIIGFLQKISSIGEKRSRL